VSATGWRLPEQAEAVEFELIDVVEREALNLVGKSTERVKGKYSVFMVLKEIS
jgi:hypothetical protein